MCCTDKTRGGKGESEEKRGESGHGHVDDVLVWALELTSRDCMCNRERVRDGLRSGPKTSS